jgi:rubrerythrin
MSEKTDNKSPKRETNRIDLTQFEGIWDKKHHLSIEKTPTDGCHWTVYFENDVEANMSVSSEFGKEIHEEADRFYHAIDKLPDLIAELKRCYEEIDEKQRLLELHQDFVLSLRPYIGGNASDEVQYAYKEAMVNAGFLWKCPDCGATYEDEQTCEYCGYASE